MDERIPEQLKQQMQNGANEQELLQFASRTLSPTQQEKMRAILQDRRALTELMQSDQAKEVLRRLQK